MCRIKRFAKGLSVAMTAAALTICLSGCDLKSDSDDASGASELSYTLTSTESSTDEPSDSGDTYGNDDTSDEPETDGGNSSVLSEVPQSSAAPEPPQSSAAPEPPQNSAAPEISGSDISAPTSAHASYSSTSDEDIPYSPAKTVTDGIELVSMTNPLRRNEDAEITIKGQPYIEYTIDVYYSSGRSTAAGLENKTSDSEGYVTWTWHVGGRTKLGDNKLVEISGGGQKLSTTFSVVN